MTDSKTATERLREMLDKRGVDYEANQFDFDGGRFNYYTEWGEADSCSFVEYEDGTTLRIFDCTPEQAIAATLKGELDSMPFCEQVDKWLHGGAPSECLGCDEGKYAELKAATLGSGECEMEKSPFMPAWRCSACGKVNGGIFGDEQHEPPIVCPKCGKVVKR